MMTREVSTDYRQCNVFPAADRDETVETYVDIYNEISHQGINTSLCYLDSVPLCRVVASTLVEHKGTENGL